MQAPPSLRVLLMVDVQTEAIADAKPRFLQQR